MPPDTPKEEKPDIAPLSFDRQKDFKSLYANNVQFEISSWDLKLIFGQVDQTRGPNFVEQSAAVTLPWAQAKIAAYYMIANIAIHAANEGPIKVPSGLTPARPDPSNPGLDDAARSAVAYMAWVHDQFFGTNPVIPEGVVQSPLA